MAKRRDYRIYHGTLAGYRAQRTGDLATFRVRRHGITEEKINLVDVSPGDLLTTVAPAQVDTLITITHDVLNLHAGVPYIKSWEQNQAEPADTEYVYYPFADGGLGVVGTNNDVGMWIGQVRADRFALHFLNESLTDYTIKYRWRRVGVR